MTYKKKIIFYKQFNTMDCGPTCLRMVAKYYGKSYSLSYLRNQCYVTREGASLLALREGAVSIGMQSICVSVSLDYLFAEDVLPCIAHWENNHFVVVYKINKNSVYIADPAHGKIKYKKEVFLKQCFAVFAVVQKAKRKIKRFATVRLCVKSQKEN